MRTALFVLSFGLTCFSTVAQKRNKKQEPFRYSYAIGDETTERDRYIITDTVTISIEENGADSVLLKLVMPEGSDIRGTGFFHSSDLINRPCIIDGQFCLMIPRRELEKENRIMIDLGRYWPAEFVLSKAMIGSQVRVAFEKKTLLNDPDSGGIIIHSKRELTELEIDALVWCFVKGEKNCYDQEECYLTIVL